MTSFLACFQSDAEFRVEAAATHIATAKQAADCIQR